MTPARIALIDSGVNDRHPHVRDAGRIEHGPVFLHDSGGASSGPDPDRMGHGTAAAAAILDLAPGANLYSLQVFGDTPDCPFEQVLQALDTALAWGPDFVNLSLGTSDALFAATLQERLARLQESGAVLVAPASFQGLPSLPGSLEGATGVLPDPALPRDQPVRRIHGGREWWYASPYPRPAPGLSPSENLHGISFAAANLTGWLAARR